MATKNFEEYVAHELRAPITVIRGYAEVLTDHPEMAKECAEKILRMANRLETILSRLLALGDTECEFKPVDLGPLIEECKNMALTLHPEAQISVHCNLVALTDADLLKLVVMNLLENGIKYSVKPAKIEVNVFQDTQLHISIRDEGIGIAKEHLTHIFDRFYAVDKARSRKLGGAGLGLALVKTIAEKLRGTICVESECGKGSVFTLTLPIH